MLEPFDDLSASVTQDLTVLFSISDVPAPTGCGLAVSPEAAPPGDAHQIIMTLGRTIDPAACAEGVYPVETDCGPKDFTKDGAGSRICAQYRKWAGSTIAESATATGGTMTIARSSDGFYCHFDIALGFGTGGMYSNKFDLYFQKPICGKPMHF